MPNINQLLVQLQKQNETIITAAPAETIQVAFDKMLRHKYSQLPVIKGNDFFLITIESILQGLSSFGVRFSESGYVEDALIHVSRPYRAEDDLFELMGDIQKTGAALVINDSGELRNIITLSDWTLAIWKATVPAVNFELPYPGVAGDSPCFPKL